MKRPLILLGLPLLLAVAATAQVPAPDRPTPPAEPPSAEGQKPTPAEPTSPAVRDDDAPFAVGSTVPEEFALPDLDGKVQRFGDLRGKVVFVHFWSTTCPWEKAAEPKMAQIEADFAKEPFVAFAINANQNEIGAQPDAEAFQNRDNPPYASIRERLTDARKDFKVLVDHGNVASRRFQAKTTPHCFVIDAKGVVRYAGALDDDGQNRKGDQANRYVRDAIKALLAKEEVKTSTSVPYG
jgi:thiol-disulfide isomerase/thioredoxin